MRKTNPVPPVNIPHRSTILLFHHSGPMPIVQNKANSSLGAAAGGAKSAKQTQSAPVEGYRWGKPGPHTPRNAFGSPIHPTSGCNRAKQTQFCPVAGRRAGSRGGASVRNKPNSHSWRGIGGASPTLRVGATAPNKPNSARLTRPQEADHAKQSQIWENWDVWARRSLCAAGFAGK